MRYKRLFIWNCWMLAYIMLTIQSFLPHHHGDDLEQIDHHGHAHSEHRHPSSTHSHEPATKTTEASSSGVPDCSLHIHAIAGDCGIYIIKPGIQLQKKIVNEQAVIWLSTTTFPVVSIPVFSTADSSSFISFLHKGVIGLRGPPSSVATATA